MSKCEQPVPNRAIQERCESQIDDKSNLIEERLFRKTPVYSSSSQLLYANVYCAICNGVNLTEMVFLELDQKFQNDETTNLLEIARYQLDNETVLTFKSPTSIQFRSCTRAIDQCQANNPIDEVDSCKNGPNAYRYN